MTIEELEQVFETLRKENGATDDDLLGTCYLLYQENKITTEQLEAMIDVLGYEFTPEFVAMSEEDKHIYGYVEVDEENIKGGEDNG